ncbi:endolytic transglycosylase MltG [Streptomyces fradiae]|uniref:endolytic transglycosylase MltG n=1 Tax=Streptomyces fradiae TaxID=1906 RepID=UPI002943DF1A|nr:endolytic transglycosylase MltG [Streptomyces fradiae]WOI60258.1 endolytic transglycosylase MltG [Streptomyces fradiae]
MTEYGRSPGSQPWHPEDPLYGDQGWGGEQSAGTYQQQPQYGGGHQDPYQQGHDGRQYDAGGGQYGAGAAGHDYGTPGQEYGTGPGQGHGGQAAGGQQYGAQAHDPQQQYGGGHGHEYGAGAPGQGYGGGWDTGTGQHTAMPYGTPPPAEPYGAGAPDPYSTPGAYPPPQPPGRRDTDPHGHGQAAQDHARQGHTAEDRAGQGHGQGGQWQAEAPDGDTRAYPGDPADPADSRGAADGTGQDGRAPRGGSRRRGGDGGPEGGDGYDGDGDHDGPGDPHGEYDASDDYDEYDDEPAGSRRGAGRGRTKKRKGRNGVACLFVALVLAGGLGGVGYVGYQFWQDRFGPAPDFTGSGTGETVTVEVPKDATGSVIGNALVKAGVVKSVDAFVTAQEKNPKGLSIQPGFYTLQKGMSAASAVDAMLSPKSRNVLIVPEGKRNAWVYEQIDKRLELPAGTTEKTARENADKLGLPAWATGHPKVKDPLEGFLFPADYPVAKGNKPEDVLKRMVTRANSEYAALGLESKAASLGLKNAWELVTVASLVQAEGKTEDDFRKMSEVVYNRLKPTNTETNRLLQFDSAFNYLNGQSEIKISESEINSNRDPYNTYTQKGLTPGPIGNPGKQALAAALAPTSDGWMYFVATDGMNKTEFAKNHADFLKLKAKFNDNQGS